MSGRYSGLQAKMCELSKKTLFIWCYAHRLNLLVEGLLKSSPHITGTLTLFQELHNFFSGYRRNAVLTAAQNDEIMVSETTRSRRSVEDGVRVVIDRYKSIIKVLDELSSSNDATTVSSSHGLMCPIVSFTRFRHNCHILLAARHF